MNGKIRTMVTATLVAVGVAGGLYVVWATLNAVLSASSLTQFLVGAASAGAGISGTWLSMKGDN